MAKIVGPRKIRSYSKEFKNTAVRLSHVSWSTMEGAQGCQTDTLDKVNCVGLTPLVASDSKTR